MIYYQATNNVIVLVVIAPAFATGARAQHNHAVFIKNEDSIVFYVDNPLLVGPNINRINNFKQILNKTFKMTNLDVTSHVTIYIVK